MQTAQHFAGAAMEMMQQQQQQHCSLQPAGQHGHVSANDSSNVLQHNQRLQHQSAAGLKQRAVAAGDGLQMTSLRRAEADGQSAAKDD